MARFAHGQFGESDYGILGAISSTSCVETVAVTGDLAKHTGKVAIEIVVIADSTAKGAARRFVLEFVEVFDSLTKQARKLIDPQMILADTLGLGRIYRRMLWEATDATDSVVATWKRLLQFVVIGRP